MRQGYIAGIKKSNQEQYYTNTAFIPKGFPSRRKLGTNPVIKHPASSAGNLSPASTNTNVKPMRIGILKEFNLLSISNVQTKLICENYS